MTAVGATASRRTVLAVVLFAAGLSWTAGNVGPVVTDLTRTFSISLAQVGFLTGTIYFGGIVAITPLTSALVSRLGLVGTVRLACVLGAAGSLIFALTPVYAGLIVGQALQGIGVGICLIVGPVYARASGGVHLLGIYGASISLGIAVALGLCSALQDLRVDWRVGFVIAAVVGLAAIPFFPARAAAAGPDQGTGQDGFFSRAVRTGRLWRLLLLYTSTLGIPLVISVWLVHYLSEAGMRTWIAGALGFLLFGVSIVARPGGARLLRRGVPRWLLLGVTPLLAAAGLVLLALEPTVAGALPAVLLMGLGFSLPYAAMFDTAQRLFPAHRTATVAFLTLGPNASPIVVVPVVGSALAAGQGPLALAALAAFVLVSGLANLGRSAQPAPAVSA